MRYNLESPPAFLQQLLRDGRRCTEQQLRCQRSREPCGQSEVRSIPCLAHIEIVRHLRAGVPLGINLTVGISRWQPDPSQPELPKTADQIAAPKATSSHLPR